MPKRMRQIRNWIRGLFLSVTSPSVRYSLICWELSHFVVFAF